MKFYEIDNALQEAINAGDKPVRLRIDIQVAGSFESVPEKDIIEAHFYGLKEAAGGTTSRGEITISNEQLEMSNGNGVGAEVRVFFSLGDGLPFFQRFAFYIDEKGIQVIRGPGRKRYVLIGLRDLSAKLKKTDEAKDWLAPAVLVYSVICDKTQPHRSLVHGIAQRAGLGVNDIDCSTIPVTIPYLKLSKNIWSELSSLATAYRCNLECPVEKSLVFAHSPYQKEPFTENDYSYTFSGNNIFYFRETARADLYRNTVRLKVNMPVVLERQEIWRYEDLPVFYDDNLKEYYPFKNPLVRVIEIAKYEASYTLRSSSEKKKNVVYADQIDTKDEAENRLKYEGGPFAYTLYDTTTKTDGAIITLRRENDGNLYKAAIHGRPIVIDQNRSCFMRDVEAVNQKGTIALNVTGSYYSDYEIKRGNVMVAQYEDWVIRELEERLQDRREFTVKTHRAVFNARVGAKVKIQTKNEELAGVISAFHWRYRKNAAFVASFKITES